jgi:S1-C subfamily serine protease
MHEGDIASGKSPPPPAGPPADLPAAGSPVASSPAADLSTVSGVIAPETADKPEGSAAAGVAEATSPAAGSAAAGASGPWASWLGVLAAVVPRRWPAPRRLRELLIFLVVVVLSASAGVGTTLAVRQAGPADQVGSSLPADEAEQAGLAAMNDENVYDKVEPGIVDINANLQYLEETAEGTGIVINAAAGLVLTNNHVIDGATTVSVTPVASGQSYQAKVLGYDRAADVALLQLPSAAELKAVSIGHSSSVTTGSAVLAIGNEAGQGGSPTVAPGVISGLDRTIEASDQTDGFTEILHGMLQTDANIRPGDSGGPLANAAGQVIGMDTAAGGNAVYSGYAIPIDQALSIARQIAAGHGSAAIHIGLPAFFGVLLPSSNSADPRQQASQERQQAGSIASRLIGCSTGDISAAPATVAPAKAGALVDEVLCGTVAASAGLHAGDVIISIGTHAVTTPASLTALLGGYRPGSTTWLTWTSPDGYTHAALVTLSAGPAG